MRLKDYLRGLGIGVVVTVLILTIAGGDEMSDAQVRARALELGMVDGANLTLSDIQTEEDTMSEAEDASEEMQDAVEDENTAETGNTENSESVTNSKEAEDSESMEETESVESSESMEVMEQEATLAESGESEETIGESVKGTEQTEETREGDGQPIAIIVARGDSSVSVSRSLEEAGLVDSAKDFDAYLCRNGYDKRISVGSFEILPGSSYEEIAKTISRSK